MYSTRTLRALLVIGAFIYGLLLPADRPMSSFEMHQFGAESAEI